MNKLIKINKNRKIMHSDAELEKTSTSKLQKLAATKPDNLNKICALLNKKAIERANNSMKQKYEQVDLKICSKEYSYRITSEEYQATKRSIGPDSWFYELITPDHWSEYEEFFSDKLKKLYEE